jgi:hypothetical protein
MTSTLRNITQAEVRETFDYDPEGFLIWKHPKRGRKVGSRAGTYCHGYRVITWRKRQHQAHRLIYLWHHGELPYQVDHANGDRSDNRIENLRAATHAQNQWNRSPDGSGSTGCKNVSPCKGGYAVKIMANKKLHTRWFKTLDEACVAAQAMRRQLHGEFAA